LNCGVIKANSPNNSDIDRSSAFDEEANIVPHVKAHAGLDGLEQPYEIIFTTTAVKIRRRGAEQIYESDLRIKIVSLREALGKRQR
jgi:hypothetical protein